MGLKFRRGTTAQKSGSLNFGEPYVNTTLGTLQIGGESGDITLGASGTGSAGSFAGISGSSLDITGNAKIDGNLTLGGAITIGDASADTVNVIASLSSSLIPQTTNAFDLGSLNYVWRDLYISTGSIKMVSNGVVVSTLSNTANGFALDQGVTANGNSSFGTSSAAITSVTGSLKVSGSISLIGALSASTITGIGNVSLYSTSVDSRLVAAESFSSSLDSTFATDASVTIVSASAWGAFQSASSYSGSFYTTINTNIGNITTTSASAWGAFQSASSYSGSIYTRDANQDTNITAASASAWGAFQSASSYSGSLATSISGSNYRITNLEGKDISITLTGDVTGTGTITDLANVSFATTIAADSVALGTDTTGNYVATMTAGTGITVGTATGEGSTPVITNTGVTSAVASTGVNVSGATGAVTFSIGQAVATTDNLRFNSLGIGMAASATAGRIDATNDVVAFSSSDIRFKENIVPIENALDKISKISGNTYDWKAENKIEHGYEGNDVGVIAQEIEAVLPQLVQTRENGFKAVKYDKLVALLIEGIKEQQSQIEKLRMDLDNYECKCDNCKSK